MSLVSGWKRLYHGETNIAFVGRRKLWFALSGLLLLVSIGSLAIKGLSFGIEFKGGLQISAPIAPDGPLGGASTGEVSSRLRSIMGGFGAGDAQVQVAGEGGQERALVQTPTISNPDQQTKVRSAIAKAVGVPVNQTDATAVGSSWGGEITSKAIRALIIFLVAIVAYISWRFELKMAVAAIIALIHDLVITAGVYSLVGFEVTPSTIVAILTILGYSLYDTVVVFDKVEENTAKLATTGRMTYQNAANLAMNQVFMRSLNTSLSTLLPVAALLFVGAGLLGATTLEDLALALLVGILVGTYSSIFVATPALTIMKEREPRYRNIRDKVLRDAKRKGSGPDALPAAGSRGSAAPDTGDDEETEEERVQEPAAVAASAPASPARTTKKTTRPPSRSRAGSKKRKRRR